MDSTPGWGRSPGEGYGNLPHDSCLQNPWDRGAREATVHGVAEQDMTDTFTLTLSRNFKEKIRQLFFYYFFTLQKLTMLDFNFILILFSESHQTNKKKENEKEEKRRYLFAILTPNRNL